MTTFVGEERKLPRTWQHGATWYYDTNPKRKTCCGDPDLFTKTSVRAFLRESLYFFRCATCGKEGGEYITPNGAAVKWNKEGVCTTSNDGNVRDCEIPF